MMLPFSPASPEVHIPPRSEDGLALGLTGGLRPGAEAQGAGKGDWIIFCSPRWEQLGQVHTYPPTKEPWVLSWRDPV